MAVQSLLEGATKPTGSVLAAVVGSAFLFVGATSVFAELQDALDRIWRAPLQVNTFGLWRLVRARLLSFGMILGIGFLLMVSLAFSAGVAALSKWWEALFHGWSTVAFIINLAASLILSTAVFAMIYKLMPRVQIDWRDVWIGAVVTALLFITGKFLIGLYLGRSGISARFGSAGSLVVVLLWVYYSAQVFLLARNSRGHTPTNSARAKDKGKLSALEFCSVFERQLSARQPQGGRGEGEIPPNRKEIPFAGFGRASHPFALLALTLRIPPG
jgi:membrane protein